MLCRHNRLYCWLQRHCGRETHTCFSKPINVSSGQQRDFEKSGVGKENQPQICKLAPTSGGQSLLSPMRNFQQFVSWVRVLADVHQHSSILFLCLRWCHPGPRLAHRLDPRDHPWHKKIQALMFRGSEHPLLHCFQWQFWVLCSSKHPSQNPLATSTACVQQLPIKGQLWWWYKGRGTKADIERAL